MDEGRPIVSSFIASAPVQEVLDRIGRTEDVAFAPTGTRLAIAGIGRNSITLLEIDAGSRIELRDVADLTSPRLDHPHGVALLDVALLDEDIPPVKNRRRSARDRWRQPRGRLGRR